MARIKKRGVSGQAKNYITRSAAVRKLQVTLPDFRRLCIFKGIYPREPRNKKKASKSSTPSTVFYYSKDIQYLLHEPLLAKFRDQKALAKKIGRALGRGEVGNAARLERSASKPKLDHIIRERYPTFVDALRDLDDCLCMLFLFANLPSTSAVPAKTIALCQRLCLEFQHYVIVSHSLRKSFLSIKGIYYGAEIRGQDILWLVPHKFVQQITGDVDFNIMGTFVEFYTTLLSFVNYKLYTEFGLQYPPKFDQETDDLGGELGAFSLESKDAPEQQPSITNGTTKTESKVDANPEATARAQALANKLQEMAEPTEEAESAELTATNTALDKFESIDPTADILPQPSNDAHVAGSLFAPHVFYLSRETPRAPLEFILKAFGCRRVGWDAVLGAGAFTTDENDPRITHQVVDRPPLPIDPSTNPGEDATPRIRGRVAGRLYVQPQWVWDSANAGTLQRTDLYAPGAILPPHLSPWMKPKAGEYDPTAPLADLGEEEADKDPDVVEGVDSVKAIADLAGTAEDEEDDDSEIDSDDIEDVSDEEEEDEEEQADFGGFSSEDEHEAAASRHQRELEAEAAGKPAPAPAKAKDGLTPAQRKARREQRAADEDKARRVQMMSRRNQKKYGRMEHGNKRKRAEVDKLVAKRRRGTQQQFD